MNRTQTLETNKGIVSIIFGGLLVGIPLLPIAGAAMPVAQSTNPCPSIFYEPAYRRSLPEGCPAAAPARPPLPETTQDPVARVVPLAGSVNVKLMNPTNTVIQYQAIGDTDERFLESGSEVLLRDLETPVTITFGRPDGGLLEIEPGATQGETLEVIFSETTDLGMDENSLRIEASGEVFVN
jgi:hypothetical protein